MGQGWGMARRAPVAVGAFKVSGAQVAGNKTNLVSVNAIVSNRRGNEKSQREAGFSRIWWVVQGLNL
ncbi:hypothetical protein CNECB9_1620005 [Cupriavidus necator]|uniref:Uncharacterized protein n=1 Tax=Cupriavidus necator TaxID=106590 RepID=A0A1K0IA37_CUPNE|nr:hypothetical protein CNECB9_1620005 [Cupriavidus necator]